MKIRTIALTLMICTATSLVANPESDGDSQVTESSQSCEIPLLTEIGQKPLNYQAKQALRRKQRFWRIVAGSTVGAATLLGLAAYFYSSPVKDQPVIEETEVDEEKITDPIQDLLGLLDNLQEIEQRAAEIRDASSISLQALKPLSSTPPAQSQDAGYSAGIDGTTLRLANPAAKLDPKHPTTLSLEYFELPDVPTSLHGTLSYDLIIDASGNVTKCTITKSSGHDELDKAMTKAVLLWKFSKPGTDVEIKSLGHTF